MDNMILFSCIICTHNRSGYLKKAIQSLVSQNMDKRLYEILVIDNKSTDNTKSVVKTFFEATPNLRYIYEPKLGVSNARNSGWKNANGKYVAYLDDDLVAEPDWLNEMLATFRSTRRTIAAVGGRIDPIWESTKPAWLSSILTRSLGLINWSSVPITLRDDQWLGEGNIAIRRQLLQHIGGFKTFLGRKGSKLLSHEGALLREQLKSIGYFYFYNPKIAVWHHIQAGRMTKLWFYSRWFWQGVSESKVILNLEDKLSVGLKQLRVTIGIIVKTTIGILDLVIILIKSTTDDRFYIRCKIASKIGFIFGLVKIVT